jgi:glycosyltransferase involved in cell wall biosynthesis
MSCMGMARKAVFTPARSVRWYGQKGLASPVSIRRMAAVSTTIPAPGPAGSISGSNACWRGSPITSCSSPNSSNGPTAEKIGGPACPWSVNYNGLREAEFEPVKPVADAAGFLFLGELRMLKGPDLFLQALATLRAGAYPDIRAVMVGDGPDAGAIRAMAQELGLSEAVAFHPPMKAREAFAMAKVFVLPSRAEALPYVALEALGGGIPMIASAVGGIPEIFGTDNPALVAPEAAELAEAMAAAAADPAALKAAMPSRQTLQARFSANAMAANAMTAYRQALDLRKADPGEKSALSSVS